MRGADGAGDRRVAAEPGRAADGAARGAALAADPAFQAALRAVGQDARRAGNQSDIYYLWSLERVCVALGLRSLDGFDWYAHGAQILLDRQESDGGWPHDRWGRLPSTCLALLFPAKGQPRVRDRSRAAAARARRPSWRWPRPARAETESPACAAATDQQPQSASAPADASGTAGADDVKVIVTGASQQSFPRISVQFEVKRPDGSFLLDASARRLSRDRRGARRRGRRVSGPAEQARRSPTTIVLVVDRSLSMEEEDRIGGLKRAVRSFLEKLPEGSKVAVIAFGSDVDRLTDFTTDRGQMQASRRRAQARGGDAIL